MSEQDDNRLYIRIYADDEPSRKAEKLYQICGETESQEVAQWLKEYFPSADAVEVESATINNEGITVSYRKKGEWINKNGGLANCSICGERWGAWDVMNYCPNCGAKMER